MDFTPAPEPSRSSWGVSDLVAFSSFFLLTLVLLPSLLVAVMRGFIPGLSVSHLSGGQEIFLQGVLNLVWVAFIVFLAKVIHRQPFLESIRWFHTRRIPTGGLIALGATLALGVLVVSTFFPPSSPPPIEKLVESSESLYMLVAFGILFAPITEEIMFRGFVFNVLSDLGGSRLAVPCTAVLFALLHAPQLWGSWAGIALIFVVGYVLSLIRERSGSLIPSFIVHTAYNSMLFGASAIGELLQRGH
jgi:membrane protease YdiL (CAAX protease family)